MNESLMPPVHPCNLPSSGNSPQPNIQVPTMSRIKTFYQKMNDCKVKPVALSLVSLYSQGFEQFEPSNLELSYDDVLNKCFKVKLTLETFRSHNEFKGILSMRISHHRVFQLCQLIAGHSWRTGFLAKVVQ